MNNITAIYCVLFVSIFFYLSATILRSFEKLKKVGTISWVLAVLANAFLVINNWVINGYIPFVSMYQVLTFLSLVFSFIYVYMKCFHDCGWMDKIFCFAPCICLIGVYFMGVETMWYFPPALQSPWFMPHVLVYMIAYSLCMVAAVVTVISFFNNKNQNKLDNGAYILSVTAFPFMTSGMFFGAIWANEVWGNFWSFDAKENWSLVTWLMLSLFLHFRRNLYLKKYAKIFVVLTFLCVVVTMFFVNVMNGNSNHSYSN